MAGNRGKQPIETLVGSDVQVQLVDGTVPTQKATVNADGSTETKLRAGTDSTPLGHVGEALKIDITSQALAGVKISRDGAAPAEANATFVELVTTPSGGSIAKISETNPLPVFPIEDPTPGTVLWGSLPSASPAYKEDVDVAANGGTANHDYTVPINSTFSLEEITVSSLGAATFRIILDQGGGATEEIVDKLCIGSGGGTVTKVYRGRKELPNIVTAGTTKVFRVEKVNRERGQVLDLVSSFVARLV